MRLYFDANALIQAVETSGRDADKFGLALAKAAQSRAVLTSVTSILTLAELLVLPIRNRDFALIEVYNDLLAGGGQQIETMPVSLDILRFAAQLRARHKALKLPDAIHIATAEASGATHIISADKRLEGCTHLPIWDPRGSDLAAFIEMMS